MFKLTDTAYCVYITSLFIYLFIILIFIYFNRPMDQDDWYSIVEYMTDIV